ncbi:hypothetical protein FS749_014542 [Ceratobasidium sp. UAMH 11750]|nr:hypothetical protein FS749_014542 [Ceratobasidium sp. UAMH 11750]
MSNKRKYRADNEFTFTYATPGSPSRNPTATTSASHLAHPPSDAESSTSPAKRARLSSESATGSSEPRRFAERFTKEKKAEAIMQYFAESSKYTLGDFLAYIFDPNTKLDSSASKSVSFWLQGHTRAGTRPAEIVDLVYRHRDGIRRSTGNRLDRAHFSNLTPPTHPPSFASAHPQDVSLLPTMPKPMPQGSEAGALP